MIEVLQGMPAGVTGIRVSGRVTADNFAQFKSTLDRMMDSDEIRFVEVIGSDYEGFSVSVGRSKPVPNTATVWGWDASNHDWGRGPMDLASARDAGISFFTHKATEGGDWEDRYYKKALNRARKAGIPVLGSYHYLWPDPPSGIEAQVNFWMDYVAKHTPWWHEHPWIWQIDAEQQGLPRPPSPEEIRRAVDAVNDRMAREGTTGYVIVYAPRWLYGDELGAGYDLWNSDYTGSGAPRPFTEQYRGVTDRAPGWAAMSGRKPRILQFASDAVVGRQHTCDVNKFDGDLDTLTRLCGRNPDVPYGETPRD